MKPLNLILLIVLSVFFVECTVSAAPVDIDPTFGQNGRVFTRIGVSGYQYHYPHTESMLVQPDGKILVSGRFWEDGVAAYYGTFMVRYMPDGTLDASFGTGGKVAVIEFSSSSYVSTGTDVALQADGKILLIGQSTGIAVRRYTSSGALDLTFGNAGTAIISGVAYEEGYSIAVQPDGKIVGGGADFDYFSSYRAAVLFRLNSNGSLDTSFGSAGTGVITIDDGTWGSRVFIQSDGKIVFACNFYSLGQNRIVLARYNADGSPDLAFGSGGLITHSINDGNSDISSAALQPNGKLVVAGRNFGIPGGQGYVVRFNADGSPDMSFGTDGVFSYSAFGTETVLLQSDGKIVLTGNCVDNGVSGYAIMRLTSTGVIDSAFGGDGLSVFPMNAGGTNNAFGSDGAIQGDGKILIAGYFGYYYTDSHENIALLRVGAESSGNTISGRVTTPNGQSLRNTTVILRNITGAERRTTTGSFGFYIFNDVRFGETYTIGVSSKRYRFAPQSVVADGDLTGLDFTALE